MQHIVAWAAAILAFSVSALVAHEAMPNTVATGIPYLFGMMQGFLMLRAIDP